MTTACMFVHSVLIWVVSVCAIIVDGFSVNIGSRICNICASHRISVLKTEVEALSFNVILHCSPSQCVCACTYTVHYIV